MPYLKDELQGLVPQVVADEIIKKVARGSAILKMAKFEQMTSDNKTIPVLVDGPGAYWVGEGERITTSTAQWIYPQIVAKKIAVIIPVTKEKLNDTSVDVFGELQEGIAESFYRAIDLAAIFGVNSPFATNLFKSVTDSNALVVDNQSIDIALSDAMAIVEEADYDPNGFVARRGVKNMLRQVRTLEGAPAFVANGVTGSELYGLPIEFASAWDNKKADVITGEWKYAVCGLREGIEYEILKEATLQNVLMDDGKPLSLAEQDMVAIKATMRMGFLVVRDDAFSGFKYATPTLGELTVTSDAGTTGKTVLSVSPAPIGGRRLVYKTAASTAPTVTYGQDLSTWTEFSIGEEITATNGHKITVAEVDVDGKAKRAGNTTVVAGV